MELFADDAQVAALEGGLPSLTGVARVHALAELAWHLRQRDSRRARGLAAEAALLLAAHIGDPDAATRLSARVELVRAECALLSLELDAAHRHAGEALRAFEQATDAEGTAEARWTLARIARRSSRDGHSECPPLPRSAGKGAAECHRRHADGLSYLHSDSPDRAIECFSHVTLDAPSYGMHELALEAQLCTARAFAMLGDADAALDAAEAALSDLRTRGWRCLVAAASAIVARLSLERGHAAHAVTVVREAAIALQGASCAARDPGLDYLLGQALLAANQADEAEQALARAAEGFREHGFTAEMARALSLQARAAGRRGPAARALQPALQALKAAREARTRAGEMEALRTLAELHVAFPSGERTARSALALLRHAVDIAEETGDHDEKASILREIARLDEAAGDLAAALAAERAAREQSAARQERRSADLAVAARARWIHERLRLEREHARGLQRAEAAGVRSLQQAHETFERLRALGREITHRLDPASIVEAVECQLASITDVHFVALFAFDRSGGSLRRYAREAGRAIPVREVAAGDLESYAARSAREQRELVIELQSTRQGDGAEMRDCATLWFGPLQSGERVLGVLTVQSRRQHAYGEPDKLVFRTLADYVALALAKAHLHEDLAAQRAIRIETEEQMHRMATVDRLTGLAVRGHFFAVARERLERARRHGGPCGLIVADVDGFKRINDTCGHEAGDRLLAAVGRVLPEHHGAEDVAGRIGGEEFALLLPGASLEATVHVAERIRTAVEALRVGCDGRPMPVTMSFGCTAIADARIDIADQPVDATLERLIREADAGLYEAQGTGGNRTIAWPAYQALRALRTGESIERAPQSLA